MKCPGWLPRLITKPQSQFEPLPVHFDDSGIGLYLEAPNVDLASVPESHVALLATFKGFPVNHSRGLRCAGKAIEHKNGVVRLGFLIRLGELYYHTASREKRIAVFRLKVEDRLWYHHLRNALKGRFAWVFARGVVRRAATESQRAEQGQKKDWQDP